MKYLKWCYFVGIALVGCVLIFEYIYSPVGREKKTLSELVIGRWVGEFQEVTNGNVVKNSYQLEFMQPDKLIIGRKGQKGNLPNIVFHYEFIGENQLKINKSRLVDEWEIYRSGEDLIILSSINYVGNGIYHRKPEIEWPLIALLLVMVAFGFLWMKFPRIILKREINFLDPKKIVESTLLRFVDIFFLVVVFFVGPVFLYHFWYLIPLRWIRIPWDVIITFEVGILLFILGFKGVKFNQKKELLVSRFVRWWKYIGVFLLGSGLGFCIVSLFNLGIILYFGSYPYG